MKTLSLLEKAKKVNKRWRKKNKKTDQLLYPHLQEKKFSLNEFLGLFILYSSRPDLFSSTLCQALNDDNDAIIKKEFLESAMEINEKITSFSVSGLELGLSNLEFVRKRLVSPSEVNLALLSYAFFSKDLNVMLPFKTIGKMTGSLMADYQGKLRIASDHIDALVQTNSLDATCVNVLKFSGLGWNDRVFRSNRSNRPKRNRDYKQDLRNILKDDLERGNTTTLKVLTGVREDNFNIIHGTLSLASHKLSQANKIDLNHLLISSLTFLTLISHTPIGAIVRNIKKDIVTASNSIGTFFSKNVPKIDKEPDQNEIQFTLKS
ncbi:hypothetical protein BEV13_00790 [Rickettsiella grylli]|nr:hypothetical protein BEV13_00790 [Rickettsiella grylli]